MKSNAKDRYYFHRRIAKGLARLGFRVVQITRIETHPVWDCRVVMTLDALLVLMVSCPCSRLRVNEPFERQLRVQTAAILKALGPSIPVAEISVMRSGARYRIAFVWRRGRAGTFRPRAMPVSSMITKGCVRRRMKRPKV